MACDLPCVSHMALYLISLHIVHTSSRSSTGSNHWRLNDNEGKVVESKDDKSRENDPFMSILSNVKINGNGDWKVEAQTHKTTNAQYKEREENIETKQPVIDAPKNDTVQLTCGKPVNYTQYDHLRGITNRDEHGHIPEPEVALSFRKRGSKSSEVDINDLEDRLWKLKKESVYKIQSRCVRNVDDLTLNQHGLKPKSSFVYSQIGNFWRIKGNTQLSIECFRKALSVSPNNPEVLLNLARVLFNLQYLDDAIFLTRRSLVMQPSDQNSWLQHFTLGEILKAYGHFQEASLHFHYALDLNPGFQPAETYLRAMEGSPSPSVTQYTLFIILFLVLGVLFGVITSMETNFDDSVEVIKTQRHFNRAMAMKSIKLGLNPRLIRMRKMQC